MMAGGGFYRMPIVRARGGSSCAFTPPFHHAGPDGEKGRSWRAHEKLDGAAPDGMVTMTLDLDESVAHAMETDVRLLPLLPALLTDLWELGPSAEQVAAVLESLGVQPDAAVLALACGKGAVAVALAEQLGVRVDGIDAFQPFLLAARVLAAARGVSPRCRFDQGDIRHLLGQEEQYDVALLLSVGPVLGDYEQTIAGLRRLVRAGGYMVIEDGFLADGAADQPWAEGYAGHAETGRQLTASRDVVIQEVIQRDAVPGEGHGPGFDQGVHGIGIHRLHADAVRDGDGAVPRPHAHGLQGTTRVLRNTGYREPEERVHPDFLADGKHVVGLARRRQSAAGAV
jgi:hypothetical protein